MIYKRNRAIDEVRFEADFTNEDAEQVTQEVRFIARRGQARLLIDLSAMTSIENKAIRLLVDCAKLCKNLNGMTVLLNPSKEVVDILKANTPEVDMPILFSKETALKRLGCSN